MLKKFGIGIIIFLTLSYSSYLIFKKVKKNRIINDYFEQGRWKRLCDNYMTLPQKEYSSAFFGDSMTENFKPYMINQDSLVNLGISGDFSEGLIKRVENVTHIRPKNIFIMIGVNDIIENVAVSEITENYLQLLDLIKEKSPNSNIYIQSVLPTIGLVGPLSDSKSINKKVQNLNEQLKIIAKQKYIKYIDMYASFADHRNNLKDDLTTDGIHLNENGYDIWKSHLSNLVKIN